VKNGICYALFPFSIFTDKVKETFERYKFKVTSLTYWLPSAHTEDNSSRTIFGFFSEYDFLSKDELKVLQWEDRN
jgi:hypothetical protein